MRHIPALPITRHALGAAIALDITTTDHMIALTLANPCEGLTTEDLPHVFERFWRKDEARHVAGHAGLGLALVRAYATQMEVECSASFDAEQRFVIRLAGFQRVTTQV